MIIFYMTILLLLFPLQTTADVCPLGAMPALGPFKPGGQFGHLASVADGSSSSIQEYCMCGDKVVSANAQGECLSSNEMPVASQALFPSNTHLAPLLSTVTDWGAFGYSMQMCYYNQFRGDGLAFADRFGPDCLPWGRWACAPGSYPTAEGCVCRDHQGPGMDTPRFHNGWRGGCSDAVDASKNDQCPQGQVPMYASQNNVAPAQTGGREWRDGPMIFGNDQKVHCVECTEMWTNNAYKHVTQCGYLNEGSFGGQLLVSFNDTGCAAWDPVNSGVAKAQDCPAGDYRAGSKVFFPEDIPNLVRQGDCLNFLRESPNGGFFCGNGQANAMYQMDYCDPHQCKCISYRSYARGGGVCGFYHIGRTGTQVDNRDWNFCDNCRKPEDVEDHWLHTAEGFPTKCHSEPTNRCGGNPGNDCRWQMCDSNSCYGSSWRGGNKGGGPCPPPPSNYLPFDGASQALTERVCPLGTLMNPYGGCQACHSSAELDLSAYGCPFECPLNSQKRTGFKARKHFCWCTDGLVAAAKDASNCITVPTPSPTRSPTAHPTHTPGPTAPPTVRPTAQPSNPGETSAPTTASPTRAPFPTPPGYTGPVPVGYFPTPMPGQPTQPQAPTFPPGPVVDSSICVTADNTQVPNGDSVYDTQFSCFRTCEAGELSLCVMAASSVGDGAGGKGTTNNMPLIVGASVSGVVFVALVGLLWVRRRKRRQAALEERELDEYEAKLASQSASRPRSRAKSRRASVSMSTMKSRSVTAGGGGGLVGYDAMPRNPSMHSMHPAAGFAMGMPSMGPGTMGPGMMAPGMMGSATMAPGMMGSATMGPGMMGAGTMGPGMMGAGTMGPGMMGASTMSPGMMGSATMGPGMMQMSTGMMSGPGPLCPTCGQQYASPADLSIHQAKRGH